MNEQLFVRTAPPPQRGRGRGCGAERRQWRMQRGGAPVAVEKIEQASSAKIFSGTARRWGQMRPWLPLERICAQYGFGFFAPEKSKFVASTAKRQRGLQRGKPGSPLPFFASFCRSKRKAPAASGANYAFAKGCVTPTGEIKLLPFAGNPSVSLAADRLPLHRGACGVGRCRFVTPCAGEAVGRCAGPGMRGHKAKNPPPFAGRGKDVFCYMAMFRMPGWLSIKARISSNLISRLNLMVRP